MLKNTETSTDRYEICLQRGGVYAVRESGKAFSVVEPFRGTRAQAITEAARMNS